MTYDAAAFGALALALTVLGGVVTFFRWRSNGLPALLRGAAWSLLPLAAWLTGVLRLGVEVASAVGRWGARLVFSPAMWAGVALAALCVVLFVVSGFLKPSRKAVPSGSSPKPVGRKGAPAMDDLDDIEAILRKHGIQ